LAKLGKFRKKTK